MNQIPRPEFTGVFKQEAIKPVIERGLRKPGTARQPDIAVKSLNDGNVRAVSLPRAHSQPH